MSLCRVCRSESASENFINIFDDNGIIATQLYLVSGVVIDESGNRPAAVICEPCREGLNDAFEFRKEATQSDRCSVLYPEEHPIVDQPAGIIDGVEFFVKETPPKPVKEKPNHPYALEEGKHFTPLPDGSFSCTGCDLTFQDQVLLRRHVRKQHFVMEICNVCGDGFRTNGLLQRHLLNKHTEQPKKKVANSFNCHLCNKTFKYRCFLKAHLRSHELKKTNTYPYSCNLCDKLFQNSTTRYVHMENKHGIKMNKTISCEHCPRKFKDEMLLDDHVKQKHLERQPLSTVCTFCHKVYSSIEALRFHVSHFPSAIFSKRFKTFNSLQVRKIHQETFQINCHICNEGLSSQRALNQHLEGHERTTVGMLVDDHVKKEHQKHQPLNTTCTFCREDCSSVDALRAHVSHFQLQSCT